MTFEGRIRPARPEDKPAIHAIHTAAFGQTAEADLVERLGAEGDLILSLVACTDRPVGHIAFSRLAMSDAPSVGACALAPLAVDPTRQRQGIGSALIKQGLDRLVEQGWDLVLVLGDPNYYGRFGFAAEAAAALRTPYDGPYLQALALSDQGREAQGPVAYAGAFAEVS
ncbi:GNAT family N-acetyltransferase [Microvirga subterranea]|uniref:Putative acetyltransferase n=1 Tax=Microvirga subterranea TaxID=186651 RepID=A0A370HLI9_9HYPH|nr:N-acetyltransferase [Microvirga subterranea]RDI59388.1 putative acetyltransferase [Microvirga subterranea]